MPPVRSTNDKRMIIAHKYRRRAVVASVVDFTYTWCVVQSGVSSSVQKKKKQNQTCK